jgi:hypothetical protein
LLGEIPGCEGIVWPDTQFKEFVVNFDDTGKTVAEINDALRAKGIFGGKDLSGEGLGLGESALLLRDRSPHRRRHPPACRYTQGGAVMSRLPQLSRRQMGRTGRDGNGPARRARPDFPCPGAEVTDLVGR